MPRSVPVDGLPGHVADIQPRQANVGKLAVAERVELDPQPATSAGQRIAFEAPGSVLASPMLGERRKILVQRPADSPTGVWRAESVDLHADFRRAYGRDPRPLLGIAVSSDSESTGTVTDAELADLVVR